MRPLSIRLKMLAAIILACATCARADDPAWTTPIAPFQIADNVYYVGSRDLASYLVVTPKGNILMNSNLASSPALIRASVEKLGYKWNDTKILLNGQAHFDHIAGAAEVVKETGARNMVMDGDVDVAETGGRTDFLAGKLPRFAPVHVDRVLHDGDTVELGGVVLTAHKTPGHTRGCTTWTMRAHIPGEPAGIMRNIVFVGGMTLWSDYRLLPVGEKAASYPGIVEDFEHTFRVLKALPCDVFLGAHGSYFNMLAKLDRMRKDGNEVWVDPLGYQAAVESARQAFETELAKQKAAAAAK